MTKWTITVIVFVARNLGCTYKHPFAGKCMYIICKNWFFSSFASSLQKSVFAGTLFALLPLYSHASWSLLATSVIHPFFNAYSSNGMFAGAVTSLPFPCHALPFFSPCEPFATRSGRQRGDEGLWVICTLKVGKFITVRHIYVLFLLH